MSASFVKIPMLPGPVTVPDSILDVMQRDYGTDDLGPEYMELYKATGHSLGQLAGTDAEVVIMTGEGMLGLWGALKSCLKPGDRVLSVGTGLFGDGLGQMAASLGCEVRHYSLPYNQTIGQVAAGEEFPRPGGTAAPDLNAIEAAVRQFKPKMITAVHCETPSGTLNPLSGIGEIKKSTDTPLLCVDAVASWGGAAVEAKRHNIDLLLGGSQKCLSAPPSMTFLAVSQAAWEIIQDINYQGYDALAPWQGVAEKGMCPYTPYWHGLAALGQGCALILAEGMDKCFARHEACAALCRSGLSDLGLTLFPVPGAAASPTVTAAYVPQGLNWTRWRHELLRAGLAVAGSFGPLQDKVFRVGHMGSQADAELVRRALGVIADSL